MNGLLYYLEVPNLLQDGSTWQNSQGCNGHKHTATEAIDPINGEIVPLYNPGSIVLVACFVGDGPDGDSGHGRKGCSTGFDYNAIASHPPSPLNSPPSFFPIFLFCSKTDQTHRGGADDNPGGTPKD
jgi:hypothetical protein